MVTLVFSDNRMQCRPRTESSVKVVAAAVTNAEVSRDHQAEETVLPTANHLPKRQHPTALLQDQC